MKRQRHWLDSPVQRAINAGAHAPESSIADGYYSPKNKRWVTYEEYKRSAQSRMSKIDAVPAKRRLALRENFQAIINPRSKVAQEQRADAERLLKELGL